MDINRNQDESQLDYHKRIIYGKLVDKTLADIDYSELSELAYGQSYSSDVARRMFYGSKKTLDIIGNAQISSLSDKTVMSEIDNKIIELQKERRKFFDQRRELSKILSSEARSENINSKIVDAANNLNQTIRLLYNNKDKTGLNFLENDAVLVFSDWHYGLKTSNIFNTYNTDICRQRVKYVTNAAKERIKLHNCKNLYILVLGDLYHGAIHTSARVASEELVCDQLMQVSEILAQTVYELSSCVDSTYVYCTYGNHARTVQNKNENIHRDNMERLVPWWLKERLSDNKDIVICDESDTEFIYSNINGFGVCASHGDNDDIQKSPRLFYTLFKKQHGLDIDCIILGDKHHRDGFEELGITSMLCGSLCGSDDYANNKRLYSTPSQLLFTINKKGVDAEYKLKCE